MAALAEQQERLAKMGARLVTVSTDTRFAHLAWQRSEKELERVAYSMGSDRTGKVSRLFGVYDEASGLALRGTFLIHPEGKVLSAEVHFYNVGRNIDELVRKFKANLFVARNPNKACPSKWKEEGDKALTGGSELVGRVHEALPD